MKLNVTQSGVTGSGGYIGLYEATAIMGTGLKSYPVDFVKSNHIISKIMYTLIVGIVIAVFVQSGVKNDFAKVSKGKTARSYSISDK